MLLLLLVWSTSAVMEKSPRSSRLLSVLKVSYIIHQLLRVRVRVSSGKLLSELCRLEEENKVMQH